MGHQYVKKAFYFYSRSSSVAIFALWKGTMGGILECESCLASISASEGEDVTPVRLLLER